MGEARRVLRAAMKTGQVGNAVEGFSSPSLVCLTYDDGPDPVGTRAVLEALREADAKATFFVMANRVRQHPSVLEEMLGEGHELALHGPDHRDLGRLAPWRVRSLLLDAKRQVEDVAQRDLAWFRPPYIALRLDGWLALAGAGLRFVASGASLADWQGGLPDAERLERLQRELMAGDVILAHDSFATVEDGAYPGPDPGVDRRWLSARVLEHIGRQGWTSVTLSDAHRLSPARVDSRVALRPTRVPSWERPSG